jgi:hypothetical protein
MTTTQLKKVNSSSVSWAQYMRRDCSRLLIQDEIEDTELPVLAASAWTFEVLNISGDWAQGRNTDEKNLWMSAGWFQQKAMDASMRKSGLIEEHRYGERVASLIRQLFPETGSHVAASGDSPESIFVPHLFHRAIQWRSDPSSQEVLENKEVFGDIVVSLAFEAVSALILHMSGRKQPSIAILWSVLRPLRCLEKYLQQRFALTCISVLGRLDCRGYLTERLPYTFPGGSKHRAFSLGELCALEEWMRAGWMTF